MKRFQTRPNEGPAIAAIESVYDRVEDLHQRFGNNIAEIPRSERYSEDVKLYPHTPVDLFATNLLHSTIDHLHMLRHSTTGKAPEDWAAYRLMGPWTLMRSALETVAQAIWLAGPDDPRCRVERLLTLIYEDFTEGGKAQRVSVKRQRRHDMNLKLQTRIDGLKARSDALDMRWPVISNGITLVDCVIYAAGLIRLKPDNAELVWRVASGYAHGRNWAPNTYGELEKIELQTEYVGSALVGINLNNVNQTLQLIMKMLEYALELLGAGV